MANSASHACLPYPIKNARFSLEVPYLDADGDPTDPTTPDTEFSGDAGAFADCAEEVTTISGSNGTGYITLTGAETNYSMVALAAKVASGPKNSLITLYPRVLAIVGSGTLSAGSAGGGTLGTVLAYDVTGCFIRTTGGTGGGGTGGANNQARKIVTYTTSTGAFTVAPDWETTPDNTTTYDVLLPEGVTLGMLRALNPATPGRTAVVDSAGLIDATTVKVGPSGGGTAQAAADIPTRLGTPTGDSLSADIAGVKSDTAAIKLKTDNLTATPADVSNIPTEAQINAQVDLAIETYYLHRLFHTTYDPANKPGASDALLNELVENDGGVARFTANTLEQTTVDIDAIITAIEDAIQDLDLSVDSQAIITAVVNAIQNIEVRPTQTILGPCEQGVHPFMSRNR